MFVIQITTEILVNFVITTSMITETSRTTALANPIIKNLVIFSVMRDYVTNPHWNVLIMEFVEFQATPYRANAMLDTLIHYVTYVIQATGLMMMV